VPNDTYVECMTSPRVLAPSKRSESVSTLALLVALVMVVVGIVLTTGAAYVVHRHPTWGQPCGAAFGSVKVIVVLVGVILTRLNRTPVRGQPDRRRSRSDSGVPSPMKGTGVSSSGMARGRIRRSWPVGMRNRAPVSCMVSAIHPGSCSDAIQVKTRG
jgi:hypothetical protein